MITPRIEVSTDKKLVGTNLSMSLANNRTGELWKGFMTKRNEMYNAISNDRISLQIYPDAYFETFDPQSEFIKWAATEVADFNNVPKGMEALVLEGGLYAVFDYRGSSSDKRVFQYIFTTWLPSSGFELDNRPHFEVLGENYRNDDPTSEEEIWIPIRKM